MNYNELSLLGKKITALTEQIAKKEQEWMQILSNCPNENSHEFKRAKDLFEEQLKLAKCKQEMEMQIREFFNIVTRF